MQKEKVTPTCRYGHGEMGVTAGHEGRALTWAVSNMDMVFKKPMAGMAEAFAYGFLIYECPVCTYLEFHDDTGVE